MAQTCRGTVIRRKLEPWAFLIYRPQKLDSFHAKRISQTAHNLQTDVEFTLFNLTQIAPAHLGIEREIVLRQALGVSETTKIGCE